MQAVNYTLRRKSDNLHYNPYYKAHGKGSDVQHSTVPKVYPSKRFALSAAKLKGFTPETYDLLEHQVSEGVPVTWDKK